MNGPRWIKQWISDMAALNEQFRNDDGLVDFDALGREEYNFRVALITKKFGKSERAMEIYRVAKIAYDSSVENGKKGGRPKKSPQDAPNGNAGEDMYDAGNGAASKSPTSCDTFTADGDIREDSLAKLDGSAITRNETRHIDDLEPSANHYGDAATREGADVSTTVSRNMRQPAKTRDNLERGRYAPPSCSPEDGNHYDQDPSISTDDTQPEGLTGPSHGGSVASLEDRHGQARESQRRTGGSSVRGMAKVAQPPVRSGRKFRNKEEFIQWAIDTGLDPDDAGNCWEATMERGGLTKDGKKVENICAYTVKWCRTSKKNRETA